MTLSPATPELPVRSVTETQTYFRDHLGFEINWHHEEGRMGAVAHGECALFFRETDDEIRPAICWIFSADVDASHDDLQKRGANIVGPLADTPWGLRQFTVEDLNGHRFNYFHDL